MKAGDRENRKARRSARTATATHSPPSSTKSASRATLLAREEEAWLARSIMVDHSFPARLPSEGVTIALNNAIMAQLAAREVNNKEAFTLLDREGRAYRAALGSASAVVYERMPVSPESPLRVHLVCPILGRQRMTTVVQKSTELGVCSIHPVFTEHSVQPVDLDHEKPWGWPGQILRAVRQCRRASVPRLAETQPLKDALFPLRHFPIFALDDQTGSSLTGSPHPAEVVLVLGPEGGFSECDRETLAFFRANSLALGGRVLRAETAVFVGLTMLQLLWGDMQIVP
jgi:16S rRNA (uracil1498-N3)-methyltransferase